MVSIIVNVMQVCVENHINTYGRTSCVLSENFELFTSIRIIKILHFYNANCETCLFIVMNNIIDIAYVA